MLRSEVRPKLLISMGILLQFFSAVLEHWLALMTGAVSLAFAIWQRVKHTRLPDKPFWVAAALCLSLAVFLAWRDKHTAYLKAVKELEEIKNPNAPRFRAEVEQVVVEENHEAGGDAQVFVKLSMRNVGADSVAENFMLHIKSEDVEYKGAPKELPAGHSLTPLGEPKITLEGHDSIKELAGKPILHGSVARGWLKFVVPKVKVESLRQPGMTYTISFVDVLGKTCEDDYVMPAS
jgi:hypothetical protein